MNRQEQLIAHVLHGDFSSRHFSSPLSAGQPIDWRHLSRLKNLELLELRHTGISDADLSHMQSMDKLAELTLEEPLVTDVGLSHLHSMTNLRKVTLQPDVTVEGVERLKDALPHCVVVVR